MLVYGGSVKFFVSPVKLYVGGLWKIAVLWVLYYLFWSTYLTSESRYGQNLVCDKNLNVIL